MYEYKFVRLPLGWGWFNRQPKEDYRQIIAEHARQGWRLVQIFAPPVRGYGAARFFELIFERSR